MNTENKNTISLKSMPEKPSHFFLVGIGGIGMSALAQFMKFEGYSVSGSDRDLDGAGRKKLFAQLQQQGIKIYPQDGSGLQVENIDAIVYSSAIEKDNPDFLAGADLPKIHRTSAMAELLNRSGLRQIAVAGSSGKTSVTGWIAVALCNLGFDPVMLNGGYAKDFMSFEYPGNFKAGKDLVVYETDESDGSLVHFQPDISVLLNVGTDHYEHKQLLEFFKKSSGITEENAPIKPIFALGQKGFKLSTKERSFFTETIEEGMMIKSGWKSFTFFSTEEVSKLSEGQSRMITSLSKRREAEYITFPKGNLMALLFIDEIILEKKLSPGLIEVNAPYNMLAFTVTTPSESQL